MWIWAVVAVVGGYEIYTHYLKPKPVATVVKTDLKPVMYNPTGAGYGVTIIPPNTGGQTEGEILDDAISTVKEGADTAKAGYDAAKEGYDTVKEGVGKAKAFFESLG